MNTSFPSDQFSLHEFNASQHGDQVLDLTTEAFVHHEPMTKHLGISAENFRHFLALHLPKFERERVSVVAVDNETQTVVATMLSEDAATQAPDGLESVASAFGPIFSVLEDLGQRYFQAHPHPQVGQHLHMFITATRTAFAGRGLAKATVRRSVQAGAEQGFKTAFCEATGKASQHVFEKHAGFQEVARVQYDTAQWNNRRAFEGLTHEPMAKLMTRAIQPDAFA